MLFFLPQIAKAMKKILTMGWLLLQANQVMGATNGTVKEGLMTIMGLGMILALVVLLIMLLPNKKKTVAKQPETANLETLVKQRLNQLNQTQMNATTLGVLPLEKGGAFDTYLMLAKKQ